jgi:AcrR family transcriptional regulator
MVHNQWRMAKSKRTDAQLNKGRILTIARDAFEMSPDASLNSIAKAAGAGIGTLYRHFPNREALVLALYRHEIQQLLDLAPRLLAKHLPLVALRRWFQRLAHYGRIKHGLADVSHSVMTDEVYHATYGPMVNAIDSFLRAGEASATIRKGVDAEDLLLLMGFLWRIEPGPTGKAGAERLLSLVLDALKA